MSLDSQNRQQSKELAGVDDLLEVLDPVYRSGSCLSPLIRSPLSSIGPSESVCHSLHTRSTALKSVLTCGTSFHGWQLRMRA